LRSSSTRRSRRGRRGPAVVVIGSLNADLVVRLDRFPAPGETVAGTDLAVYPGGKGANQACAAALLGARVAIVGRVGADANGRMLRASLARARADPRRVAIDRAAPTGMALIAIDATGQNEIVVVPGANGRVGPADVRRATRLLAPGVLLLLQLEIPLAAVALAAREARAAGATVILDPAPARTEALDLLPFVDYLTPNETELATLVGRPAAADLASGILQARELLARGARRVVAKLGARGALLVTSEGERHWPAPAVTAVDTTAAGDVWNGAFAAALAGGSDEGEAGRFATEAASRSVTRPGAQPSMPTRADLRSWRLNPLRR
jgi:ribokinase